MRLPTPRSLAVHSGLIAIVDLAALPGDLIEDLAFHGALVSLQATVGPAELVYNRVDDTRGILLTRPLGARGPLLGPDGEPMLTVAPPSLFGVPVAS